MHDQHKSIPAIPRETARMARAVFGRSNYYIRVGEQLESMLEDVQPGYPSEYRTQRTIPILPLITYFQFVEGLTDAQSEDAVRTRIDWKFALHRMINAPVFLHNDLCGFRRGIINDAVNQHEFQRLIDRLAFLNPDSVKSTTPLQVLELLMAVCSTNRLSWILEAMSRMLEYLACKFPDWLREVMLPHWVLRYQTHDNLPRWESIGDPSIFIREAGTDIAYLLESISRLDNAEMTGSREVGELRRVWNQQFERLDSQNLRLLPRCSFCVSAFENKSTGNLDSAKEGLLNNHN
jgi:transposase